MNFREFRYFKVNLKIEYLFGARRNAKDFL